MLHALDRLLYFLGNGDVDVRCMTSVMGHSNCCELKIVVVDCYVEPAIALKTVHLHPRSSLFRIIGQRVLRLFAFQLRTVKCVSRRGLVSLAGTLFLIASTEL
jgi:hypothetical protein